MTGPNAPLSESEVAIGLALGMLCQAVEVDRELVLEVVRRLEPSYLAWVHSAAEALLEATS